MREVGIIVFPIFTNETTEAQGVKGIFPGPWEVGRIWSWCHSLTLGYLETSGSHLYIPIRSLTGDNFASYITEKVHIQSFLHIFSFCIMVFACLLKQ